MSPRAFTGTTGANAQYLDARSPVNLDDQEPFTVAAWIYAVTTTPGANPRVVSKDSGSGFWSLQLSNAGAQSQTLEFVKDFATVDLQAVATSNSITLNQWTHVAATWDATTLGTGVKLYINAKEVSYRFRSDGTGAKNSDKVASFRIGNREVGDQAFDGTITCVTFHTRVLSENEIGQLQWFPGSVNWAKMKGMWPVFSPGGIEYDYGTNSNHANTNNTVFVTSYPPISGLWVVPCPAQVSY